MDLPRDTEFSADLSPLAWVQEELRRSLEAVHKALRRYQRDADGPRLAGQDAADTGSLSAASQQVHQAAGVMSLVGLPEGATLLRANEAVLEHLIRHPALIKAEAIEKIERADFALMDYVARLLARRPVNALSLFPPYRALQTLSGAERVHPADLWTHQWTWQPLPEEPGLAPRKPEAARSAFETTLLAFMRQGSAEGARALSELCASMGAGASGAGSRNLWQLAAAFFEAQAAGLLQPDAYAKRIGSRLLAQLRAGAKAEPAVAERLAADLLFFCAQSTQPSAAGEAPRLEAVRAVHGLTQAPADYEDERLGRIDPAWVSQARKRVSVAKDAWSAVAEGDMQRLVGLDELFALVAESLQRLFPRGEVLGQTLQRAVVGTARAAAPPSSALAMEVATSMLYVEAALEDAAFDTPEQAERVQRLAQRVDAVAHGDPAQPLEAWMEDLYRRVSDRQTMGSVVQELRSSLSETEKLVDEYFRDTSQRQVLIPVPGQLSAMRGVLTVLGMEQAAQATLHMRDQVDELVNTEVDASRQAPRDMFERLAGNLGALGFMIDMLSVQPQLAKRLFRYDDATGLFGSVMGRRDVERTGFAGLDDLPPVAAATGYDISEVPDSGPGMFIELPDLEPPAPALAPAVAPAVPPVLTATADDDDIDAEMLEVFLEECHEVVAQARDALAALQADPHDQAQITTVRRAFHTLKGSSRMVGLLDFGEGAWACEQLYNARMGTGQPADAALIHFSSEAIDYLFDWSVAIAYKRADGHHSADLRRGADALRLPAPDLALSTATVATTATSEAPAQASHQPPSPETLSVHEATTIAAALPDLHAPFDGPAGAAQEAPPEAGADFDLDLTAAFLEAPEVTHLDLPDFAQNFEPTVPAFEQTQALTLPAALDSAEASPRDASARPRPDALPDFTLDLNFDEPAPAAPADLPRAAPELPPLVLDGEALEMAPGDPPPVAGWDEGQNDPVDQMDLAALVHDPAEDAPLDLGLQDEGPAEAKAEAEAAQPATDALTAQAPAAPRPHLELVHSAEALARQEAEALASAEEAETIKVIGPLRISIALFNIFLNEADEQSRRLSMELAEWALELDRPVPTSSVALAHSLAGNAGTVGFDELSHLARLLEHALDRTQALAQGSAEDAQLFIAAADEIRRLLHQFAAGFLKPADPELCQRLLDHEHLAASRLQDLTLTAPLYEDSARAPLVDEPPQAATASTVMTPLDHLGRVEHAGALEAAPTLRSTAARGTGHDSLDLSDLDAEDAIDPELFPIFEDEGVELLEQLGARMRDWQAQPGDMSQATACMRHLHTLKGSARLAGAMRLGEMAHRMESVVESLLAREQAGPEDIEQLHNHVDAMAAAFELLRHPPVPETAEPEFEPVTRVAPLPEPEPEPVVQAPVAVTEALPATPDPEVAAPALEAFAELPAQDLAPSGEVAIDWSRFKTVTSTALAAPERAPAAASQAQVRVRAPLLERLINQAGEVSIRRSRMESEVGQMKGSLHDLSDNLERLRSQLRDMELQADAQISSRLELAKQAEQDFDPLEFDRYTRVQELTRIMAESVGDVATVQRNLQKALQAAEDELAAQARLTRDLQDDLLSTRMVEFDSLSDRLYRVLRQAAKETGKQVRLDVQGGAIEVDRGVLERMTGAFEHLLRNSVIHGIESPEQRQAAGKEAAGNIVVALSHEGNEIAVEFRDDGAGLNLPRIRERGLQLGLLKPEDTPSDAELTQLIFQHGFSTASSLSELAGRGVGMDVVRDEVNAMGGRIVSATTPGQGTSFKLLLPLTTAVTQVVMLRCAEHVVAVPATLIERVLRVPVEALLQAYSSGSHTVDGELVPFFWLGGLLQQSARGQLAGRTQPMVVVKSAQQRVALHVDEVIANQEVVVKNLGPQLVRVPGLAGITLLASGMPALIYNPVALATLYGESARRQAVAAEPLPGAGELEAKPAQQAPLVMVVDDSLTVRRVTQRLLQREGFRVLLAKDGLDALERLADDELPAVVLSDIEMPRMDGFDLVRNVRADARLRDLPVIMITSRIAQKHREYATELGVQHYLGKPYDEEELLSLIGRYTSESNKKQAVGH